MLVVKVDRLCAPRARRHCEPLRHAINRDNASGAEHPGALDSHLRNRAGAPNSDSVTRLDAGILRGHVAGGKNVG